MKKKNREQTGTHAAPPPERETGASGKGRAEKKRRARGAERAPREKKPLGKKLKRALILVLVITAALFAGITAGAYYVSTRETNLPKVLVDGIEVGGLSREETAQLLEEHDWDEDASLALRVKLPAGVSFKLDLCQAGAMFTKEGAVEAAFRYGHTGNLYKNLWLYLKNLFIPVDVSQAYLRLDEEYIRQTAEKGIEKFYKKTGQTGYTVDTEKAQLSMIKGAGEMEIDLDALCAEISEALLSDQLLLERLYIDSVLSPPDFESIRQEILTEAQDARFAEESFEVIPETVGCDFDTAQAQMIWEAAQPGEKVKIPLVITQPEVTAEQLESLIFRDKLGSVTTYYTYSNDNRINNINLAAASLDGLILMPGQVFSYNETVGQRTEAAGYLPAGAYNDGQVVQEVGGGICQVSSTLYCAVMYAQLKTVERTCHYFPVDYLTWGRDATVSWPGPDYKFENSREYPIKLSAYCDNEGKALTIEVWGTDLDGSYVELQHKMGAIFDDEYTDVVVGYGVSLFRNVYDADGNYLYQVEEPYGIYHLHDEQIQWPEPSTEPETEVSGDGEPDWVDVPVVAEP